MHAGLLKQFINSIFAKKMEPDFPFWADEIP